MHHEAILFGFSSLFNHHINTNLDVVFLSQNYVFIYAAQEIHPRFELLLDYTFDVEPDDPMRLKAIYEVHKIDKDE